MRLFFKQKVLRARLEKDLDQLEALMSCAEQVNTAISQKDIGWHLSHSLIVLSSICKSLTASDPAAFKHSYNVKGLLILTLGHIPRGVAKSPRSVIPSEEVDRAALSRHFGQVRHEMDQTKSLHRRAHFVHPVFGALALPMAIRFMQLHTHHHLKIARDIAQSQ